MTEIPDPQRMARGAYRIRSPEVWDQARRDYVDGHGAPAVCARHGLSLSTLRRRAALEGWRRLDQRDPEQERLLVVEGDLQEYGHGDLAELALIHLREAVVQGRAADASAWLRINARLGEMQKILDAERQWDALLGEASDESPDHEVAED